MTLPQLRVRTEFTFRQAFGPVPRVADALVAIGCPAAGMVDPGTWGHTRWAKELAKRGCKPLFGTELTLPQADGRKPTAWALAASAQGFYRFSTEARREGADLPALFSGFSRDLVRFAGSALTDPECFDYVDLNPASALQQRSARRLAAATGRPLVITSDNRYPARADAGAFLAMGGREQVTPQHILSEAELRAALLPMDDGEWARAVAATHEAAERCCSALPTAPLINFPGDLRALSLEGKAYRLAAGHIAAWTDEYEARLQRELKMIAEKRYDSYFFVVADLVQWAKTRMLVGPARGSSAGSLVCYLLRITEIDPLRHELLFERFIDVSRNDLPDIDIDFNDQKRDLIFDYLADKYGRECVARIGNINTLKPRSVMAEVCKRMGIPEGEKFAVMNVLIEYSSGDSRYGKGLEDTLKGTEPGKRFAERYPEAAVMFELENHAWHTGVHAAGVIVCNEPISNFCTVGPDGVIHGDKPVAEALGLLKIDALGLRTLGIIEDSGVVTPEQLYALDLADPEVLKVFNDRRYAGVFQFEGQAQRRVAAEVDIKSFRQIDHCTALARPGPLGGGASQHYIARAKGNEPVEYRHPSMEAYLSRTMGVVLYQEQVMRICFEIGKFSWEVVSEIRKAMSGRKGKEYFDRRGDEFVKGAATIGVPEEEARLIWSEICTFGAWGMNASFCSDTEITLAHPNQFLGRSPTIAQLYEYYVEAPSDWIRQRKLMPVVLCAGSDGVARPTMAVNIHKNGAKPCVRLEFDDGSHAECTRNHKFIINGRWTRCGKAIAGDEFSTVARDRSSPNHAYSPGVGKAWRKGREGAGANDQIGGKFTCAKEFRLARTADPCEDCGTPADGRMEIHHNDLQGGLLRPADLAWLCNGCHKQRHIDDGSRRPPYARGHQPGAPKTLVRVTDIGVHETYDIEMPAPNHNYVLGNGLVTHNSHTVSYGVISYWCAWMKRYHPVEFAAACLRSAKDDDQTLEILRDMAAEGVRYVPFDPARSAVNWAAVDGELIGGFMNLVGFGPAKSTAAAEARDAGRMDEKLRKRIADAKVKFTDLTPVYNAWRDIYDNPEVHGCREGSVVKRINEVLDDEDVLIIGRMTRLELRDQNETIRVARRGGKLLSGQTIFLDIFVTDDSGVPITLRVDRFDYEALGKRAAANLQPGDDLLVRGRKIPNFSMIKVQRMKCLNRPEAL